MGIFTDSQNGEPCQKKEGAVNQPAELDKVLQNLQVIHKECNIVQSPGRKISFADLIMMGGYAAAEEAANQDAYDVTVPFSSDPMDVSQEQINVATFSVLESAAGSLCHYVKAGAAVSAWSKALNLDHLDLV